MVRLANNQLYTIGGRCQIILCATWCSNAGNLVLGNLAPMVRTGMRLMGSMVLKDGKRGGAKKDAREALPAQRQGIVRFN